MFLKMRPYAAHNGIAVFAYGPRLLKPGTDRAGLAQVRRAAADESDN